MKERAYWMARVCSQAKHPQQLWRLLNTLMGASEKNNLPRNCPSAQEFADFFEAMVAEVRKATGNSGVSTELQPATEVFDHFETYISTEVNAVITRAPTKSCEIDPIPTDVLKKFLFELLPYITDMCNSSLQQGSFSLSQRHVIIRPRLKKPGSDPSEVQNYRPVFNLTFVFKVVRVRIACVECSKPQKAFFSSNIFAARA